MNIDNYESFIARGSIWGSYKFENFKTNAKLSISLVFAHEKTSAKKINKGIMQGKVFHRIADLANRGGTKITATFGVQASTASETELKTGFSK